MNMDQVIVLVYTDRYHKTRVLDQDEVWELFTSAPGHSQSSLYSESELLELWDGEFDYVLLNQAVINGDWCDWEEMVKDLNYNWANRFSGWNTGSSPKDRGTFGFVTAGVLDPRLFSDTTFTNSDDMTGTMPTDFKLWMQARQYNNYIQPTSLDITVKIKPDIVVEKTSSRKAWVL
jgi:hypothetical protein